MSKQSKKGKRNSDELDIILAQLKKSYNDDNMSDIDDDDSDSFETTEDSALNSILEKLFSNNDIEASDTKIEADTDEVNENDDDLTVPDGHIEYESFVDDSDDTEISLVPDGSDEIIEEDTDDTADSNDYSIINDSGESSEEAEAIESVDEEDSSSLLEKINSDNDSEQDVEDILHLMFASNTSENIEHDEYDASVKAEEAEEIKQEDIDSLGKPVDNSEFYDDPIIEEYSEEDLQEDELDIRSLDCGSEAYADDNIEFAVEDEEYDIASPEPERPTLILDPTLYTYDPLQQALPKFRTEPQNIVAKSSPEKKIEASSSVANDKTSTDNLDSNDISLLLKFGYDEEVKSKIGEENTQKILIDKDNDFSPESHRIPYGFCGKELTDRSQLKEIREKYRSDRRSLIIKACFVAVIAFAMFALEIFFEFFSDRSSFLIVLLCEIVLVALIALILYKKLITGILGIVRFEATSYSVLVFLMCAFMLCNLSYAFLYIINYSTVNTSDLMLFGVCTVIYTLIILVSDIISCQRQINTFDIISSSKTLYTTEKHKDTFLDISSVDRQGNSQRSSHMFSGERAYKIRQTSLISGYFRKMSKSSAESINLIYVLGIVPILALITGCTSALISGNIMRGISSMMITTFMCTPFSYILLPVLTEFITSLILKKNNSAFIGSEAISDYSKTDAIFFRDIDAIEVISYTEIQPSKSADSQKDLEIAYQVFNALGGPLGEFTKKLDNVCLNASAKSDVVINSIADNGIELYFDSSINVLIGDKNYMQNHKIKVKTDSNLNTAIKGFDRSVIYMAFDGIPKLGFIITSKIKPDFANTVSMLDSNAIKVFVDTYETQINDLYFEQNKTSISTAVNVCKSSEYESSDCRQLCDGAVICSSDSLTVADTIARSRNIIKQRKNNKRLHFALVLSGFFFSCLLALLLNVNEALFIISGLKTHITLLFNFIMALSLIPCIISTLKLTKNKF